MKRRTNEKARKFAPPPQPNISENVSLNEKRNPDKQINKKSLKLQFLEKYSNNLIKAGNVITETITIAALNAKNTSPKTAHKKSIRMWKSGG